MKFAPHLYAEALSQAIANNVGSEDALIERFVGVVAEQGDLGHSDAIVEAFAREETRRSGGHFVDLAYAREPQTSLRSTLESQFTTKDYVSTSIVPGLIAGVRVTVDGTRELDGSLAGKLTRLFHE